MESASCFQHQRHLQNGEWTLAKEKSSEIHLLPWKTRQVRDENSCRIFPSNFTQFRRIFLRKSVEKHSFSRHFYWLGKRAFCLLNVQKHELENGASVIRWKVGVEHAEKNRLCPHYHSFRFEHLPFSVTLLTYNRITTASPWSIRETRDLVKGENHWEKEFPFFLVIIIEILTFFVIVNTRHLCKWKVKGIFMPACQRNVFQWTLLTSF